MDSNKYNLFCPNCGTKLENIEHKSSIQCKRCRSILYSKVENKIIKIKLMILKRKKRVSNTETGVKTK